MVAAVTAFILSPRPALAADTPRLGEPLDGTLDAIVEVVCGLLRLPLVCPQEPPHDGGEPAEPTTEPVTTSPTRVEPTDPIPTIPVAPRNPTAAAVTTPPSSTSITGSTELGAVPQSPRPDDSSRGNDRSGAPQPDAGPLALELPADVDFSPGTVALAAAVSVVGLILIGFPAELFNQSVRENYSALKRLFPWIGRGKETTTLARQIGALILSSAVAGFIGSLQNLGNWSVANAVTVGAALGIGFLATTAVFEGVMAAVAKEVGMPQRTFRAYPGSLPFVALFVGISAVGRLQPAYVYGHIAGSRLESGNQVDPRKPAIQTGMGSVSVLVLALVCWGLRPVVPQLAGDILAGITIVALNWLVFSLVPVTFLEGEALFGYSKALWAALYIPSLILFLLLVLMPATRSAGGGAIAASVSLFVLFAALSLGVWAYFRYRGEGAETRR